MQSRQGNYITPRGTKAGQEGGNVYREPEIGSHRSVK